MKPEQKMQAIVEAAGYKVTERYADNGALSHLAIVTGDGALNVFPSPTDLNELFRLAEKVGFVEIHFNLDNTKCGWYVVIDNESALYGGKLFTTPAEALLNALYEAIKES